MLRKADNKAITFAFRWRARVGRRHGARVPARDLTERPVPATQRVPHVLAQLVHHGVHRVLDAGVDPVRNGIRPAIQTIVSLKLYVTIHFPFNTRPVFSSHVTPLHPFIFTTLLCQFQTMP